MKTKLNIISIPHGTIKRLLGFLPPAGRDDFNTSWYN